MTEAKLIAAAEQMSEPAYRFPAVQAQVRSRYRNSLRRRAIAVLCMVVLMAGCTYAAVSYTYWAGPTSEAWVDAQYLCRQTGIQMPEELYGSPFNGVGTIHTSAQDISQLWAWLFAPHKSVYIEYGTDAVAEMEDGSTLHYTQDEITVQFSRTDNEYWQGIYKFDDDGNWVKDNLDEGSMYSVEYADLVIFCGSTSWPDIYDETHTSHSATWVDEELGVVFIVSSSDFDFEDLVECAKEIIDMNS